MSFEIRPAKPSPLAVTRRPRPGGASAVHQFQWHATRGAVAMDRQVSATENWFAHPSNDRDGWGSSADFVIGPDFRVGGRIVIVQFGDPFETYGSWSAGYGGRGENTIGAAKVGIAIEVAQPAGIDRNGRYVNDPNASFEDFTPETIEACAWLVNEINSQLADRDGGEPIPAVHLESWDQHQPIPRGHIGHEDLANGVKLGKCIAADTSLAAIVNGQLMFATAEEILVHDDVLLPCVEDERIEWRRPLARERRLGALYQMDIRGMHPVKATAEHKWARFTHRGQFHQGRTGHPAADRRTRLWRTDELSDGFAIPLRLQLDRPSSVIDHDAIYGYDIGYLVGVWVAEGSDVPDRPNTMRFSLGPTDHETLVPRIKEAVTGLLHDNWGLYENKESRGFTVHAYGGVTAAIIRKFIRGRTSKTKRFTQAVWQMPDIFLVGLMDGYLDGDGHKVEDGYWHLGLTNNRGLMDDLRFLSLLLGYEFREQSPSVVLGHDVLNGTIRTAPMLEHGGEGMRGVYTHRTVRSVTKHPARSRVVWDVTMGGSGLFLLGNGLVTHNSDPGYLFPYDDILTLSDGSRPPQNELIETMENMANRANAVAAAAHEMAADAKEIVTRLKSADQRR